jgi:alcohol dehydrogenase (cytochrome c)
VGSEEQWSVIRKAVVAVVLMGGLGLALVVGVVIGNVTSSDDTKTVTVDERGQLLGEDSEFSVAALSALPKSDWLTNGGSLSNERFSPLDEIDTRNVGDLKGDWTAHLDGSGIAAKYSGEATPVVHDGIIYTVTGADDVFATDADDGRLVWKYEARLDQKIDTVCCGWTSRGVALGQGMVFVGQLDGTLVALDQRTGGKVWEARVGDWRKGETVTGAPLYYDGRVHTGVSGGEYGIRGRLTACDARTGKRAWRFWTVPGPGETGHDTWPKDNDTWKNGGAPVWQTPSVDPDLGLMYFSTGNASPDWSGAAREGDNLFAASIVAIDAKTGKYRWHFQQVHHDIWDFDAPSPTILFDAAIDGKDVKGIAEAGKTGWLYMLDRRTGKPIHPIVERSVQQDSAQKTAKTQPIPSYPQYVQDEPTDEQVQDIREVAKKGNKGKPVKVVKGKMFDSFGTTLKAFSPAAQGGTNWPPSSYNRDTQMVYVCGVNGAAAYSTSGPAKHVPGQGFYGSALQLTGFQPHKGVIAAIDVTTGKIAWKKELPTACYSGTTTTAGDLVFVGNNDGTLRAYDARNGKELWRYQLGAGANSTPAIYEHDGTQRIAFYAAGNSLMGNAHGDSLWQLSLKGRLAQAKPGDSQKALTHAGEEAPAQDDATADKGDDPTTRDAGGAGNADIGRTVFGDNCATCHGAKGAGGNGGPTITGITDTDRVMKQVANGGSGMPPFKNVLSPEQIRDVTAFITKVLGKQK